ncbi:MAG: hypothetical protein AAF725_20950 [Acidobacteriota bacterium]
MDTNLFEELKEVLGDFRTFLKDNVDLIRPAIVALASLLPQLDQLVDQLIGLVGSLKREIEDFDLASIGAEELGKALEFVDQVTSFLTASKDLLPGEADTIDGVLSVANVAGSLPNLDDVKQEILDLLDQDGGEPGILQLLQSLKAA